MINLYPLVYSRNNLVYSDRNVTIVRLGDGLHYICICKTGCHYAPLVWFKEADRALDASIRRARNFIRRNQNLVFGT